MKKAIASVVLGFLSVSGMAASNEECMVMLPFGDKLVPLHSAFIQDVQESVAYDGNHVIIVADDGKRNLEFTIRVRSAEIAQETRSGILKLRSICIGELIES